MKNKSWLDAVKKAFTYKPQQMKMKKIWIFNKKDDQKQTTTTIIITITKNPPIHRRETEIDDAIPSTFSLRSKAALVIQTFFRGYLARRALEALKGIVKLQALVRGDNVRKRAKMTLKCMQTLVRIQARICQNRTNNNNIYGKDTETMLEKTQLPDHHQIQRSDWEKWEGVTCQRYSLSPRSERLGTPKTPSSPIIPGYMSPTKSARERIRQRDIKRSARKRLIFNVSEAYSDTELDSKLSHGIVQERRRCSMSSCSRPSQTTTYSWIR